jgi:endonuclease/exonuclease/phosphatase family metal-dependent hydrolase
MMRIRWSVAAVLVLSCVAPSVRAQEAPKPLGQPAITQQERVPVISWADARAYMDREVFVVGKVVLTKKTKTMFFLNFSQQFRGTLTIAIRAGDAKGFDTPPDKAFADKVIKVHGWITEFKGAPEILGTRADQIAILPDDTPVPASAGPSEPATRPARDVRVITVATFNVENLYDAWDDPYANDEGTPVKSRADLEKLAKVIRDIDADVLSVDEVENRGILEEFNRIFLKDMGYTVVLFEGNDVRGIDVALLTRLPVGAVTSYRHLRFMTDNGEPQSFQRDLLQVRLEPPGAAPMDVFLVHLKSKEGADDTGLPVRMAEAKSARKILDEVLARDANARFVVCGDFNDLPDSEPLKVFFGSGPTALRSFHEELPAEQQVTYNKEPYRSMIDFILCSPAMAKCYVPKSFHIIAGTEETIGTDHNPVVVKFKIK